MAKKMKFTARFMALFVALALLVAPVGSVSAATYRTWIAQLPANPVYTQTVRIWMNSDTVFGETAGVETKIGSTYVKYLGTYNNTGYPGANWYVDLPTQPAGTFVEYQLFTRNQSGSDYGFSGFNWNYTVQPLPANVYVNILWTGATAGTDPDGAGPATNFGGDAFATLQAGVDGVASGGTVWIAPGAYAGAAISKNLTLDGDSADTVIISGTCSSGLITVSGGTSTIRDVRLVVEEAFCPGAGIYLSAGSLFLQNAKLLGVDGETTYGIRVVGGGLSAEDNLIQTFNRGIWVAGGTAILGGDVWSEGNLLDGNLTAVMVTGTGSATVRGNTISRNYRAFSQSGGTLIANANNITNFSFARTLVGGTTSLKHNYWGTNDADATMFSGLTAADWNTRLAAPIQDWALSSAGTLDLSGASISGAGNLQIVDHGPGATIANRPFGNGIEPFASQMCSSFFDVFVESGGGAYSVELEVSSDPACAAPLLDKAIFWIPPSTNYAVECLGADNQDCWDGVSVTKSVSQSGQNLVVSGLTAADLGGTQFVVGDIYGLDPTAIQLVSLEAGTVSGSPWAWFGIGLGVAGLLALVFVLRRRK